MRRWALGSGTNFVSGNRNFRRPIAPLVRSIGRRCLVALALCGVALAAGTGLALAQSDQQIRCMQLQQDLVSAQGGGGNRDDIARIDQQIAQADRVFQGTQAAMEDANCFQSFFIFGRGLNRSPQCLKMNDRVEDARRQLSQLQEQRQALSGGGGNRRRQAELQEALARAGCGGQVRPAKRSGGLFGIFGGGGEDEQQQEELPQTPVYRSIDPNGRYRSVCVRLCDGFFYPISYATWPRKPSSANRAARHPRNFTSIAIRVRRSSRRSRSAALPIWISPSLCDSARNMCRAARASRPNIIPPTSKPPTSAPKPRQPRSRARAEAKARLPRPLRHPLLPARRPRRVVSRSSISTSRAARRRQIQRRRQHLRARLPRKMLLHLRPQPLRLRLLRQPPLQQRRPQEVSLPRPRRVSLRRLPSRPRPQLRNNLV
jgi:hypothetical protein